MNHKIDVVGSISSGRLPIDKLNVNFISHEVCGPAFLLGKIMGFLSWDFDSRSQNHPPGKRLFRVLCLFYKLLVALGLLLVIVVSSIYYSKFHYNNLVSNLAANVSLAEQLCFVIIAFLFCFVKENNFRHLLFLFDNAEKIFAKRIEKRLFLAQFSLVQVVLCIIVTVSWIVGHCVNYKEGDEKLVFSIFGLLILGTELFFTVFFVETSNLCAEAFSSLSVELNEILTSEIPPNLCDPLHQLRLKYEQLYQLADYIQETFSFLMTVALADSSLVFCFLLYMLLNLEQIDFNCLRFLFSVLLAAQRIYFITTSAGNITVQAREGLRPLHNVYHKNLTSTEEFQIVSLTNKLNQTPVEISSFGRLFTINANTFTVIMSTILTYLIVLMQFNTSPDDGSSGNTSCSNKLLNYGNLNTTSP